MQPWEAADPDAAIARLHRPGLSRHPAAVRHSPDDANVHLGHDTMTVPLQGFLFVPPGSVASVREFGDLSVLFAGCSSASASATCCHPGPASFAA